MRVSVPTPKARQAWPWALFCAAALTALPASAPAAAPGWSRLIDAASAKEQVAWGERYEQGGGVRRNLYRAVALYCSAAEKGDPLAAYRLGRVYATSNPGLPRDDALAAAWLRRAAAKGASYASGMLGLIGKVRKVEPACRLPKGGGLQLASLSAVSPAERKAVEDAVHTMAPRFGLDPRLVLAVIAAESAFDRMAVSPKGAQGLMQLMPDTASRFGVADAFDAEQNLRGGMTYLAWLLDQFRGDVDLALAGYNAGEKAVEQYRGIPPYDETREYVRRVRTTYRGPKSAANVAGKGDGG